MGVSGLNCAGGFEVVVYFLCMGRVVISRGFGGFACLGFLVVDL